MRQASFSWYSVIRTNAFRLLVVALAVAIPRSGLGQVFSVPSSQIAIDLKNVEIGTWSEHLMSEGGPLVKQRYLLVQKNEDSAVIELKIECDAFLQPMVFRLTLATNKAKKILGPFGVDLQIAGEKPIGFRTDNLPIIFPAFLDRGAVVGRESIRVGKTVFATTHYHHDLDNETWDYWVSSTAPPLGFVRSTKQLGNRSSAFALVGLGSGGRPEINEAVQHVSFDEFARRIVLNTKKSALP